MKLFTFTLGVTLIGCTPRTLASDETLGQASETADDTEATVTTTTGTTTETTASPACEPPEWFACPATDICAVLECDAELGKLDEDGCPRASCSSTEECATGERCIEIMVAGFCESSGIFCDTESGQCACGSTDDCTLGSRCVDEEVAVAHDCPIEGADCPALIGWSDNLQFAYLNRQGWGHTELAAAASSCSVNVEEKIFADAKLVRSEPVLGSLSLARVCRVRADLSVAMRTGGRRHHRAAAARHRARGREHAGHVHL